MTLKVYLFITGLMVCSVLPGGLTLRGADAVVNTEASVKHVNPKQAEELIAAKKVTVLDIRTPGEFKADHIAGATNINFLASDFEQKISHLDPNKPYLVHCASGGRSTHSLPVLAKHHFRLLYHLDGGLNAWQKQGLPLEKGN